MTDTPRNGRRTEPRSHRLIPEIASVPVEPTRTDPAERRRILAELACIRTTVDFDPAEIIGRD